MTAKLPGLRNQSCVRSMPSSESWYFWHPQAPAARTLRRQMERIAEDGEGEAVRFHQLEEPPEIRVQDWVAAGDIKIGQPIVDRAKIEALVKGFLELCPAHGIQLLQLFSEKM